MSQPSSFPLAVTGPASGVDDLLDRLHLSFDATPPRRAWRVALSGGEAEWVARWHDGQARLTAGLCADAVAAVALRRLALSGRAVRRDRWLLRLTLAVAQARHQALSSLPYYRP